MKQRFTSARVRPPAGTRSVDRALAVLDAFGRQEAWALSDLARALGMNKTTVYRLLGALERAEYVARDAELGTWTLGPGLLALANRALRTMDLYRAAHDELAALAARTGETTTLEILAGRQVLILDEVKGRHLVGSSPEVGTRWPAHATSTGKVLLAAARRQGGAIPGTGRLERLTPHTIGSRERLRRELDLVDRRGYAVAEGELEPWFTAIGAGVRNHEDRVVAAISAGGPSARLTAQRLPLVARHLVASADRISRRLGAPPLPSRRPSPEE